MAISIRKLAKAKGLRQRELAEILQTDQSVVSLIVNGHRRLTEDHIELLLQRFGAEELAKYEIQEEEVRRMQADMTIYATDLVEEVEERVQQQLSHPKREDAEVVETLEAIPILSPDQVKSPNFDVKSHVDNGSDQIKRLPIAQILAKFGEFEVVSPTYRDSMIPAYMPGDFLFVQYKRDWHCAMMLKQGIYLIDTTIHGSILCMIEDMEDGKLRLTFKNSKKYKPMIIDKDIVLSVATVSFFIRMGDMAFDVEDTAYLQHLLDCQIDQYNQLMVQYGKTGDRVDRIISQNEHLISNHERIIDVLIGEKKNN